MRSCVVGASAGLGRALATCLAARGDDLFLISSDARDLDPVVADLGLRFGVEVHGHAVDLATACPRTVRENIIGGLGGIDALFVIAGASSPDDTEQVDDGLVARLLAVNLVGPLRLINALSDDLAANSGHLVGIGSVAAIRARRSNFVYATAKRGLEFYFESLRHRFASGTCSVCFYRLGYLKTRMTFGQKLALPALSPEKAAKRIVSDLGRRQGVHYLPRWWGLVALALQSLPWVVFKKLDF